jgi:ABC-type nitrate/sulfonate/bicarbonate transport system ATPase subunit
MKDKAKNSIVRQRLTILGWDGVHEKIAMELERRYIESLSKAEKEIVEKVVSHVTVAELAHAMAKEEKRARRGLILTIPSALPADKEGAV